MNSFEFRDIINSILEKEKIGVSDLATKVSVDRTYLSKVKNSKREMKIGPTVMGKMKRAYPSYFGENNKNDKSLHLEPSPMQILDRLSLAFIDQAKALADQAEGFKAQAEAFKAQGELMKSIERKMAREETQAKMETNLNEVRSIVDKVSILQNAQQKAFLKEFSALRNSVSHLGAKDKRKVGDSEA